MVKLKEVNNGIAMDQGWDLFSIAHDIKIGYFLTFKPLKGDVCKVMVFDHNKTWVVYKC
jgi:hypothetical protein